MFEHSVKVPRHFKVVANIVKQVSTEGGSVKTLLYDNKLRHFKTNVLYALVTETIKNAAFIDKIFAHCELLQTENRLDPWLAKVLTTELLFGKKTLPGQSKPEQTILSYKEPFEKYVSEHQDDLKNEAVPRPRYIRINTNLLTTSDAIRAFQDEGYHFIRCTSGSYDDYLEQIQKLTEFDFTQDYHIKTIFVFAPGTKWHDHDLYLENKVILQDKATAMAVHLLAPPPGSVCLDMCAAPGMKTTQLAAYLRNEGKIYAVERDAKRYQTLCDFVEKTGSKCVTTLHRDSLEIKRGDHDEVEYILLDPSCSGSGMDFCVHNYIEETRLAKLTSLQEKFLKHAMNAFPNAKRIIYSTCSIYPEENERVVSNVVKTSRAKWRVQDVKDLLKGQWNNFGSGMYGSMGNRCMYAKPETDFTTGFFLAVLDRDDKDLAKAHRQDNEASSSKKVKSSDLEGDDGTDYKAKEVKRREDLEGDDETDKAKSSDLEGDGMDQNKAKAYHKEKVARDSKKVKPRVDLDDDDGSEQNNKRKFSENIIVMVDDVPKKKKRKRDKIEVSEENNIGQEEIPKKDKRKFKDVCDNFVNLSVVEEDEAPKKKKKDKRNVDVESIQIAEDVSNDISESTNNNDTETKTSKKKKKRKEIDEQMEIVTKVKKKSKVAEID